VTARAAFFNRLILYGLPLPMGCEPHGIGFDPKNQDEIIGCKNQLTVIIDGGPGNLISGTIQQGGSDLAGYDAQDNRFYVASANQVGGPSLGVFDGTTGAYMGGVKTDKAAHSLVIDPSDGKIYVGAGGAGTILVFAP
jgi:DNA-binding beta-propeller fold protein YncE